MMCSLMEKWVNTRECKEDRIYQKPETEATEKDGGGVPVMKVTTKEDGNPFVVVFLVG